jgi:hypothetical protein
MRIGPNGCMLVYSAQQLAVNSFPAVAYLLRQLASRLVSCSAAAGKRGPPVLVVLGPVRRLLELFLGDLQWLADGVCWQPDDGQAPTPQGKTPTVFSRHELGEDSAQVEEEGPVCGDDDDKKKGGVLGEAAKVLGRLGAGGKKVPHLFAPGRLLHLTEEEPAATASWGEPLLSPGPSPYVGLRWIQPEELQRLVQCTGFGLDHMTHRYLCLYCKFSKYFIFSKAVKDRKNVRK